MKDKERRAYLVQEGYAHLYMQRRKEYMLNQTYIDQYLDKSGYLKNALRDKNNHKWIGERPADPQYFGLESEADLIICERIRQSIIEQTKKIKMHIQYMFAQGDPMYFMTFTFNDDSIQRDETENKHWITRLLNEVCKDYIINKDYGKGTERLHYHAVIQLAPESYTVYNQTKQNCKLDIFDKYEKKMGFYYAKPIRKTGNSIKRLTRYLNKLTLHTTKVKQEYISTKKGTDFQKFKKQLKELKKFYIGLTTDEIIRDLAQQTLSDKTETEEKLSKLFNHHYDIE